VGGLDGGIHTGIFSVPELSWTAFGGLLYTGDLTLLGAQLLGILVTIAFVGVLTTVIGLVLKVAFKGLRVDESIESEGMDATIHGESAYPAYNGLD
jgi:Amt family ammonium transporter